MAPVPGAHYLAVEVDGEAVGIDVRRVRTVAEYRETAPIPGRPGPFLGALNHYGELLPVVFLATLLGREPRFEPTDGVIAVVDWEDGVVGFLVERCRGLVTAGDGTRRAEVLGRWAGPFFAHTVEVDAERLHVLDIEALLADLARRI